MLMRRIKCPFVVGICYGIADIFPQTSQITCGEQLLFFFVNNLFDVPEVAEIGASMVYFEQIDAILEIPEYFRSHSFVCYFLAEVLLFVYFFEGEEIARFLNGE